MTDVLRARLITVVVTAACWCAHAASASPGAASPASAAAPSAAVVDALASGDRAQVERAVGEIAGVRAGEGDPDVLFAAARACEEKLLDPGRAVVLYERVVAEHAGARIATMAARRAVALRELVGPRG